MKNTQTSGYYILLDFPKSQFPHPCIKDGSTYLMSYIKFYIHI